MNAYSAFSMVYDILMKDVEYELWADYIEEVFKKEKVQASNMAELACGTGNLTNILANRGYHLLGTDISEDMLYMAREKEITGQGSVTYIQQDMCEMQLPTQLDAVICACDGFNYILEDQDLQKVFSLVKNHMKEDGVFIFDISSDYKLKNILGYNIYAENHENVSYIWENFYDEDECICDFDLTIFIKEGQFYKKFEERHSQRAYTVREIKEFLQKAGFTQIKIFDGYSFNEVRDNSERISFICR